MTEPAPGRHRLSTNRSLILDVLHFSRAVPAFPAEKEFDLAEVAAARDAAPARVSWAALFLKAYGIVAARTPELRRAYIPYPWPHYRQYPHNVGVLSVAREYLGEDRIFWAFFKRPEETPLKTLQAELDRYKNDPVEALYAGQIAAGDRPLLLRRFLMWLGLYWSGQSRADVYGTFAMSVLAGYGVYNRGHQQLLTTSLSYGPLSEQGKSLVTLLVDHRVFDGAFAARVLIDWEKTMRTDILTELKSLSPPEASRLPADAAAS